MTTTTVSVVNHPLVQHKLTLMRERDRSIKNFRELVNGVGTLLFYEVTRDLPPSSEGIDGRPPVARF